MLLELYNYQSNLYYLILDKIIEEKYKKEQLISIGLGFGYNINKIFDDIFIYKKKIVSLNEIFKKIDSITVNKLKFLTLPEKKPCMHILKAYGLNLEFEKTLIHAVKYMDMHGNPGFSISQLIKTRVKCSLEPKKDRKIYFFLQSDEFFNCEYYRTETCETIILDNNITILKNYSFSEHKDLKNIVLPKNLKEISKYCFKDCEKLEKINFPDSLETIESNAFSRSGLTEIIFPPNLKNFKGCFVNCNKIKKIIFSEGFEGNWLEAFIKLF